MKIREAQTADIPALAVVRLAVLENRLSRPELVTPVDYLNYLTQRGKGWVAEVEGRIVGFAIADLVDHNIWALFLHPNHEKQGIGRSLHDTMLNWYFDQTSETVWLSTGPGTRAEEFYRRVGWRETGRTRSNEVRFEMSAPDWLKA